MGGLEPIVQDAGNPPASYPNPWIGATPEDFVQFFEEYFWFLPEPNGTKTGLVYIIKENFFERKNPAAIHFLNTFKSMTAPADKYTTEIFDWTYQWVTARGLLMDSAYSKRVIATGLLSTTLLRRRATRMWIYRPISTSTPATMRVMRLGTGTTRSTSSSRANSRTYP